MAFNDQYIKNSKNISLDAECYQFSYFKLLGLLKNNHSIKNICLGYSYFNFSSYYDEYIDGKFSKDFFGRYFFILPFKEQKIILVKNKF